MSRYLFLLGATSDLCWAELQVVAKRFGFPKVSLLKFDIAELETDVALTDEQLINFQNTLGGTIKIVRICAETELVDVQAVGDQVITLLEQDKPRRFVVSEYGRDHLPTLDLIEFKEVLRSRGVKSSYAEASRHGANAAQLKRGTDEVYVFQFADKILYGWTETVQDVDSWSKRDMKKPVRDRERGMLQPKVARMMLNLAFDQASPADTVVLDPFSGTGTILIEAADLGSPKVFASDFSEEAVMATNQNLTWWTHQSKTPFTYEIVRREVSHLTPKDFSAPITHIVTEPFLGKLRPAPEQLPGIIRGLEKLYRGMVKSFATVLQPGAKVVIILPAWEIRGQYQFMDATFADFEKAGFEIQGEPLRAGRVESITQRFVYVLEYKPYVSR